MCERPTRTYALRWPHAHAPCVTTRPDMLAHARGGTASASNYTVQLHLFRLEPPARMLKATLPNTGADAPRPQAFADGSVKLHATIRHVTHAGAISRIWRCLASIFRLRASAGAPLGGPPPRAAAAEQQLHGTPVVTPVRRHGYLSLMVKLPGSTRRGSACHPRPGPHSRPRSWHSHIHSG